MDPIKIIGILCITIVLLLTFGFPIKIMRFLGQGLIKLLIGAILLFFLNAIGSNFGIHVPINLVTSAVSGLLGIAGVIALVVIQLLIL